MLTHYGKRRALCYLLARQKVTWSELCGPRAVTDCRDPVPPGRIITPLHAMRGSSLASPAALSYLPLVVRCLCIVNCRDSPRPLQGYSLSDCGRWHPWSSMAVHHPWNCGIPSLCVSSAFTWRRRSVITRRRTFWLYFVASAVQAFRGRPESSACRRRRRRCGAVGSGRADGGGGCVSVVVDE